MQIEQKIINAMAYQIGQMTFVANNKALRELLAKRGITPDEIDALKDLTRRVSAALMNNSQVAYNS